MLIINKEQDEVRLIVTVSKQMTDTGNGFRLFIHSPFTNKEFSIILPSNSSQYPERFDEFLVDVGEFSDLEAGGYNYIIYEHSSVDVKVLEKGLLRVLETTEEKQKDEFEFIEPTPTEDDYVTYQD